ncbi:aldo/keto reductase [Alicyclobacillus ferrooxydans]|uniref:Oxidoreductase n=1 Tax=Alicyclobacillus ferrooxydans TaxID=471514 RepID=A0A0N8PNU9_9BACL|nr:aldo/keto reductase [Alicyclobacillus ferrooxydans]KPV42533.1 oxidoreductase [Alicyclobacillus ferrooxydans]
MEPRQLGRTTLQVFPVGLGCMSFPDERTARELVQLALDAGVNFFDTADLYGQGTNELWLGNALKGRRSKAVVATKVGNRFEPGKPGWSWGPSREYILRAAEDSLRRLQTDYIDLYQLHGGTLEDPIDDIIEAFELLQEKGYIRAYGISSIRPNVVREYARKSRIATLMSQYGLLDRRPEEEVLDLVHDASISVIARGPLARGWLTAQGRTDGTGFLDYNANELPGLRVQLTELAGGADKLTQLALRYSLDHPAVAVAIPGSSSKKQLMETLHSWSDAPLREEELAQLQVLLKQQRYEQHR